MDSTNTISISDLRQKVAFVIDEVVKTKKPKIILKRSKPKVVLLDIDYFESLEEMLFDITDAKEAQKAKKEAKTPFSNYLEKRWGKTL